MTLAAGTTDVVVSGNNLYTANFYTGTVGEYNATTGAAINSSLVTGIDDLSSVAVSGNTLFVGALNLDTDNEATVGTYNATTGALINAALVTAPGAAVQGQGGGDVFRLALGTETVVAGGATPPPLTPTSVQTTVSSSGSGANYSNVAPVTATGGLGTTVSLIDGSNTSGSSQNVVLATTNLGHQYTSLASDVVSVTGNAGSIFTVQLTF